MEKALGVTEARQLFGAMVEQVQYQGDTYVINRHGKPAAAIVPMPVYEAWKRQRQEMFDQIRQMQQEADLAPDEADRLAAEAIAAARIKSLPTP